MSPEHIGVGGWVIHRNPGDVLGPGAEASLPPLPVRLLPQELSVEHAGALLGLARQPIAILELSTRPENALRRYGITMVGELLLLEREELAAMHLMGPKGIQEIGDRIQTMLQLQNHPAGSLARWLSDVRPQPVLDYKQVHGVRNLFRAWLGRPPELSRLGKTAEDRQEMAQVAALINSAILKDAKTPQEAYEWICANQPRVLGIPSDSWLVQAMVYFVFDELQTEEL